MRATDPAPALATVLVHKLQLALFRSAPLRQMRQGLVRATNRMLREFRASAGAGLRVIWIAQAGVGELLPGLAVRDEDERLVKPRISAFFGTDLDQRLMAMSASRDVECRQLVIVAGITTHADVRSTAIDAVQRGYDVRVAVDVIGSDDPEHESITERWLAESRLARVQTIAAIADDLATLRAERARGLRGLTADGQRR